MGERRQTEVLEPWSEQVRHEQQPEPTRRSATQRDATRPERQISLQQTRRAETRNRIGQMYRLPLENPPSHRNSQSRVTQMNQLHSNPALGEFRDFNLPRGHRWVNETNVPYSAGK